MRAMTLLTASVLALSLSATIATAEIAVSANDGKQVRAGDNPPGPTKDYASIIVFGQQSKPTEIGRIDVPERPLDLVFGGADHRTLFILTHTSLYSVRTKSASW